MNIEYIYICTCIAGTLYGHVLGSAIARPRTRVSKPRELKSWELGAVEEGGPLLTTFTSDGRLESVELIGPRFIQNGLAGAFAAGKNVSCQTCLARNWEATDVI